MLEIRAIAAAVGVEITLEYIEYIINVDPTDTYFKPSMQQDIEKGNYIEFENIVGEPLREANRLGVPAPTLFVVYGILKGLQAKVMEERGLIEPKFSETSKYRK
jgi:ketopantoate reductase